MASNPFAKLLDIRPGELIDPGELLLMELARAQAMVDGLDQAVSELGPTDLTDPPEMIGSGLSVISWHGANNLVTHHLDQRKHLAAVATAALKIGLQERALAQSNEQARILLRIVQGVLGSPDIQLTQQQQQQIRTVLAALLRSADPQAAIEAMGRD